MLLIITAVMLYYANPFKRPEDFAKDREKAEREGLYDESYGSQISLGPSGKGADKGPLDFDTKSLSATSPGLSQTAMM